jgi:DNA-binding NarL/FixJ family response regulator
MRTDQARRGIYAAGWLISAGVMVVTFPRPPDAVAAAGMETLTNREREVVALVAHGMSNDEIAGAVVLSPATAKTHVSRAMIKLGARDRAQLVVFAYQTGLVSPRAAGQIPGH